MHGLVNRALQSFVCNTYGQDRWKRMLDAAGLGQVEFEAMFTYEDRITEKLLAALATELDRPLDDILEDVGTYLVSHPELERLRRLLRFGGETYPDFLHSLDDLPDRARLAVPDLDLPTLELREYTNGDYCLNCGLGLPGFTYTLMGILRAMADDYGALVLLDYLGGSERCEQISISVIQSAFSEGRTFELGASHG
ncbi:heme NO-binding domain-containing protein [Chachezhania antarctica]|uniref:heme NO-binding domain-containing protein n=1 Tax=Chachezhania antarctica TaxID=2340860 RepID=UPI000EB588E0|nr:heme NO-binding domain-containing protein [Chachezhania antarctica]